MILMLQFLGGEVLCVQMWDLYSREKIDIKADIWVRASASASAIEQHAQTCSCQAR